MRTEEQFSSDVITRMREELKDAASAGLSPESSVEMLWVGLVDQNGRIIDVSPAARGVASMVPALFPHMSRGDAVIHNHPGGDLRPSRADMTIATRLGNQGIGFLIVDDAVENVNVVAAPLPKREIQDLNVEELSSLLEPEGKLAGRLEDYENRPGQIALLRSVARSFNDSHPLIVEAGTGVGKSFAYLLPALAWAATNDERVVVSTATIALQQQLMEKDIPLALKMLGADVKVALVKGRGNYLCLKRLEEGRDEAQLFSGDEALESLRLWALETPEGSRSDIPFRIAESLWSRVRCEADNCPGPYCRFYDRCFLMRARRKASEASLLVANHHLLFADLSARLDGAGHDEAVVLPPYRRIVIDEAHHVENSATSLFTASISLPMLSRLFRRLYWKRGVTNSGRNGGLLQRLADVAPERSDLFFGELPKLLDAAKARAETLDALGRDVLAGESQRRLSGEPDNIEKTRLAAPMNELRASLQKVAGMLADLVRELDDEENDTVLEALLVELRQSCTVFQEAAAVGDAFLHRDEYNDQVFWLESKRQSDGTEWLACHKTPLSIASIMREAVWEPYETVIAMSATLALGGKFQHWRTRVGADRLPREAHEGIFPSPFDFSSRVLLTVPSDAPLPEDGERWENFLSHAISEAIDLSGGHALVLFTSYETLRKTIRSVQAKLGDRAPRLLAQGDEDRGRLLTRFREDKSSVLFATDSFWEGVDVPGSALSLVIITRLPFRPPTDPVAQARREAVSASGGNPFMQLSLPDAVTRFRQGFGRLMRRTDDHGVVMVLDVRILRKQYGSLFIESLPPAQRSIKSLDAVLRDVENFLFPG